MTSVFQSVNNCPRVDISITNSGGTITDLFSQDGNSLNISNAGFSSSYKGPQKNIGLNQQNGSDRVFKVKMPAVPSDDVITVQAKEHLGITVFDTKTKTVTVNPAPGRAVLLSRLQQPLQKGRRPH